MIVSIIGLGFVGGAMIKSFKLNCIKCFGYDKFKKSDSFKKCLSSDIMFLALPTMFNENTKSYDKTAIYETCEKLVQNNYKGIVIIKSTVEPETTFNLQNKYNLKFIHNPEFLSAATAFEDFENQKHIVLGITDNIKKTDIKLVKSFYKSLYPKASISVCSSSESESMKIFLNCFYATKVQFFNEIYLLCEKTKDVNYEKIKKIMLKNNWINPMHTNVPGPDGKLSYGGYCFPKDTNALLEFMKKKNTPCHVLASVITERNIMVA